MTRGRLRTYAGLAALSALVAGCGSLGNPFEALGAKKPSPDEFAVVARAPLVMPGSRALPPPTPGTISPLDPRPQEDAIRALTGRGETRISTTATSRGEQVLLSSANAAAATPEIRVQLEQDEIDAETNKEYEAPLITEVLFGSSDDGIDEEDLLDPNQESRRLQTSGLVAPVNPNEAVPEVEPDPNAEEEPRRNYDFTGRPENTPDNTVPRF
ncbi:MAG: DUF3035 domain-containing protein [Pseudomonadota bacterium]